MLNSGCSSPEETHKAAVEKWHEERVERLKEDRGWLKLAGLYWLDEGEQSFGDASHHPVNFPEGSILQDAGKITLDGENGLITLAPAEDGLFTIGDEKLIGSLTFPVANSPEFEHGRIAFTFIERGDWVGLRLYDQQSPIYTGFKGIERFPVDFNAQVIATLVPHDEETTVPIVNILGQVSNDLSPGVLHFEYKGEEFTLTALDASEGARLFLIIGDLTNRTNTFGGGRFMYVDNPGPNGQVKLDFNMLYNPPCAFTDHTTCPLPPPENRLNTAIEAGEKRYQR
ncbi:MAG: DUF1684 domain-containing protein [Balneolales bacterium]|nr:DUF1684 domain-containing protein [Balneolales bacterium]